MDNGGYSLSDIAAAANGLGGNKSEGGWAWLFLIIVLLAVGGGAWGNHGPVQAGPAVPTNVATTDYVQNAINNQTINDGIQKVMLSSADNNYQTAQLISGQTETMMQMNNTNQINTIQGFNNVVMQLTGQTNTLASKLDAVMHHQDECCCTIQKLLMQQQLDEANRRLLEAQNKNNIAEQSQYLLGNMGRWVGWAGSGSPAAAVTSA